MNPVDIVGSVLGIGGKLIDRFFPDPVEAAKAKMELLKMDQASLDQVLGADLQVLKAQLAINEADAKSNNWFQSGWRPFSGWVAGTAFAYSTIVEPFLRFVAATIFGFQSPFPVIDTTLTMQVLFALLGLGGFRTYEKQKGLTK